MESNKINQILGENFRSNVACSFTGRRPNKIYGYNLEIKEYKILAKNTARIIEKLVIKKGIRFFFSGGALGFDTVAFFAVEYVKKKYTNINIKNIICVPCENQSAKWTNTDKERYNRMFKLADEIIYTEKIDGYIPKSESISEKMNNRNKLLVDLSMYLISCWEGEKRGGTYNTLEYAKRSNRTIINIDFLKKQIREIK